jgi:hypothetical protein
MRITNVTAETVSALAAAIRDPSGGADSWFSPARAPGFLATSERLVAIADDSPVKPVSSGG